MSGCVARVKLNGPLEFLLGSVEIPVEAIQADCQRGVSFAKRAVQFQSFNRGGLRFGERLFGSHYRILPVPQQSVSVGQARIGLGVSRILFNCLLEISQGGLQTIRGSLIPKVAPFEIGLVSFWINNFYIFQRSLFLRSQVDPNFIGDLSSNPVLERQGITELALVAPGP